MLKLTDCNQFNAKTLSKQIRLMKKANPPPKLHEHKIFEGGKKKSKIGKKLKKKRKKKNYIKSNPLKVKHENRCSKKQQNKCCS